MTQGMTSLEVCLFKHYLLKFPTPDAFIEKYELQRRIVVYKKEQIEPRLAVFADLFEINNLFLEESSREVQSAGNRKQLLTLL